MNETDKKMKQLEKISTAIATFKSAEDRLSELAKCYDQWIDEEAMKGNDAYSDELLECKVDLEDFIADLNATSRYIEHTAVEVSVYGSLSTLPGAVKACNGLLNDMPDLSKVGKSLKALRAKLDGARESFRKMRKDLSISKEGNINPALRGLGAGLSDPQRAKKIEAAKRARDARLALAISKEGAAVTPAGAGVDITEGASAAASASAGAGATDIDAITKMIDDEKKKN